MKKALLLGMLVLCLVMLCGCTSLKDGLRNLNSSFANNSVQTPESSSGDMDWDFVPVVREKAETLFKSAAPDAQIENTIVTSKNGKADKAVVVIEYSRNGTSGSYGFEYELEDGEYKLTRYGEGVTTDDIH